LFGTILRLLLRLRIISSAVYYGVNTIYGLAAKGLEGFLYNKVAYKVANLLFGEKIIGKISSRYPYVPQPVYSYIGRKARMFATVSLATYLYEHINKRLKALAEEAYNKVTNFIEGKTEHAIVKLDKRSATKRATKVNARAGGGGNGGVVEERAGQSSSGGAILVKGHWRKTKHGRTWVKQYTRRR